MLRTGWGSPQPPGGLVLPCHSIPRAREYDPHASTGKQTLGPTAQIHFAGNPLPLLPRPSLLYFSFFFPQVRGVFPPPPPPPTPRMNKIILFVFGRYVLLYPHTFFIFNSVHYSIGHPLQGFRILRILKSQGKHEVLSASVSIESSSCSNRGSGGGWCTAARPRRGRGIFKKEREKCLYCRIIMQLQS